MAKNTGKGHRKGAIKERSQFKNTANGIYMKRDEKTGRFVSGKKEPYKGVRLISTAKEEKLGKVKKNVKKNPKKN